MLKLPEYIPPDFKKAAFVSAPCASVVKAPADGCLPDGFYATTIYPEYFKIDGAWELVRNARMDCCVVIRGSVPEAVEPRLVRRGDDIVVNRSDDGSDGIFVDYDAFLSGGRPTEKTAFAFRKGRSRETSYSSEYDKLYDILRYERDNGYIVWVLGPAVDFDYDARKAMQDLILNGYADVIFGGNALATHDLEAAVFHTGLGQDIYTKRTSPNGHYHHLETINMVRRAGSVRRFVEQRNINNGIMAACVHSGVPFVLAGSIRDDGPLPDVVRNVYDSQGLMRRHVKKATTVIALATQLHTIATGNMTPIWKMHGGKVRPVFFYNVDVSEFAVNKLRDRGSLSVNSIVTNVQDFLVNVERNLIKPQGSPVCMRETNAAIRNVNKNLL